MKCQILFPGNGENLHEMSDPVFWEKQEKIFQKRLLKF